MNRNSPSLIRLISGAWTGLAVMVATAQVPDKCFEIESILVDACISNTLCPGSVEAMNEMVRFKVGADPIDIADIDVQWPNNSFNGFVQDAQTASLTATLNATIEGCGWLVEPVGGIIPGGSSVLAITSTDMCTAANSFAGLSDTLQIIYQLAGNLTGHFVNHNNGPDPSPVPVGPDQFRTLIMTYVPTACGDTVTYNRALLVNVLGTYGGLSAENDGATVHFSWPGFPMDTYVNYGCQAAFEPLVVEVASVDGDLCNGGSVILTGSVDGAFSATQWQGGAGVFSDPTELVTSYTAGPGETGIIELSFCAIAACGEPVCNSIQLSGGTEPSVIISGDLSPCTGTSTELVASGAETYVWSTTEATDTIVVFDEGTYTVTGTTACGSADTSVTVTFMSLPDLLVTSSGDLCPDATLTATGANSYVWTTSEITAEIVVNVAGTYGVVGSNSCGWSAASIDVMDSPLSVAFTSDITEGEAPLTVQFDNESQPLNASFEWDFGDLSGSMDLDPEHDFIAPGVYIVVLEGTFDGCTASASAVITVMEMASDENSVTVPNVFSPNQDGINDVFEVEVKNIASMEVSIYNRWGQLVGLLERPRQVWDARTIAGEAAPEGTYFYVLSATGEDGSSFDLSGSFTLLR